MQVKKQQFKPDMEQQTGSKLGKEYVKAVYYHPAYLTDMQSVSYGGWCQVRGIQRKFHSGTKDRVSVIESFVKQIIY